MQIVHHIFEEMVSFTNDDFWKCKLLNASRGRFDKNYGYKDLFLYYRYKKKIIPAKLPENDPPEALRIFVGFMNTHGVFSDMDAKNHKNIADFARATQEVTSYKEWSKVPMKSRPGYIRAYIEKRGKGMSEKAVKSLERSIEMGINLKIFDKTKIKISNFSIVNIIGLEYNEEKDLFLIKQRLWNKAIDRMTKEEAKEGGVITEEPFIKPVYAKTDKKWAETTKLLSELANRRPRGMQTFSYAYRAAPLSKEEDDIPSMEGIKIPTETSEPEHPKKKRRIIKKMGSYKA